MTISLLEAEIGQQPAALGRLLEAESERAQALAARLLRRDDVTSVVLAARGSSDNAARYAQYVLGAFNRLQVALATPSLFTRYQRPPRLDGALVMAVSQSGRSPDVVAVISEAATQGRPTVAVTNEPDSPLAAAADGVLALHAGAERSVAATKTYVNSLGALALLSAVLADDSARLGALAEVPALLEVALAELAGAEAPAWLVEAPSCVVIGRGFNYATAYEVALKIKELSGVAALPYSSADFLHGPIAAAGVGLPVVLVAPTGAVFDDVAALLPPLRERGAPVLAVSDDARLLAEADAALPLPPVTEWLSPLVAVVAGQVLAWRLARGRGLDVDRPAGLRKVTETH